MPQIPQPLFPDDDGTADPEVIKALDAEDDVLVNALRGKRVFVAVVSHLVSSNESGGEKESEMALALLAKQEKSVLPIFTSINALTEWRADARPVQVLAEAAGLQALHDDLVGVVVDRSRELSGRALRALVFDFPLIPIHQDPVVESALQAAIDPHEEVVTAWMSESDDVDAVVSLLIPSLMEKESQRVASAVASWLAADPQVRLRSVRGFDVQVVTAR